ncbi:MAG: SUMF1/EgtB/PvdO family nonheme iron enzyme [Anaerolineae bacterium]|nr:SUMF1/EgtB/PvdO family nonheme iron enzyme [Anaerolineae bacterium]
MTKSMRVFEIFLSSPGDVEQERDDAQDVINAINNDPEFDDIHLKLYRWDDKEVVIPMSATDTPQKSVDIYMTLPSKCDLVVVIFWSRMGSPLVMDDREYLSGTHYEYSEAIGGYEQHGTPKVWLYRCAEEPSIKLTDPKRNDKIAQFDRVQAFFSQFQDAEGRYTGGVNSYPTHADFKDLFRKQLETYLRHVKKNPTNPPPPPPTKPKIDVPYKGLKALRAEDVPIFFGRTAESLDVLARIENKRLVPIVGASGSGKSSLVMAGVLPELAKRGYKIIQFVPDRQPFNELALAMVSQIAEFEVSKTRYIPEAGALADILRDKPENLVKQLRAVLPTQKIAIYIDQFEELFTIADPTQVESFIQAIRHEAKDITTILTMRADFYETALAHLDELKNDTYGLKKPSPFALYEMITRPAQDAGYVLDDRLAETIINQLGDDSGALALMAYLMETMYWRAKARGDKHITYADYEALGGVNGAMNTLAEKAYADLPFDDKEAVLRNVFFHLIALTFDENGQLVPTRGRYPLDNFAPDSPERVLIDQFADARLLVKDGQMVEVAHEAILRHWEQLVGWIEQNKGSMALYRQFERDAKVWADNPHDTPLPLHESLQYFHKALGTLGLAWDNIAEPLKSYTEPESARLLRELDDIKTLHRRRYDIGERLARIGDPRTGIGVLPNGIPDIAWCHVEKGGQITIEKQNFTVKPFYVAKYLTTHAQYQAFVEAEDGYNNPEWWKLFPEKYRPQGLSPATNGNPNAPRDSISWYQSVAFANWLDAKYRDNGLFEAVLGLNPADWKISLPPEWYWQWMAQNGSEARDYPWGAWDEHPRANTTEASINDKSTSVGMYPHGIANCGAYDVAGNLWEWCLNDYKAISELNRYSNGQSKVLRGGAFGYARGFSRAVSRSNLNPNYDYFNSGVRVFVVPIRL